MKIKIIKHGAKATMEIPADKGTVNFYGFELPLDMLSGATYWIGGDPNCGNSITADRMVVKRPEAKKVNRGRPSRLKPRKG